MTDKELLELAAKAAEVGFYYGWRDGCLMTYQAASWNPLTDDGDALRLAVNLRLKISTPTTDTDCAFAGNGDFSSYSEDVEGITITDLYAATRRAIVRAAAEIGKTLL
jgi:hypothetical protein